MVPFCRSGFNFASNKKKLSGVSVGGSWVLLLLAVGCRLSSANGILSGVALGCRCWYLVIGRWYSRVLAVDLLVLVIAHLFHCRCSALHITAAHGMTNPILNPNYLAQHDWRNVALRLAAPVYQISKVRTERG